MYERKRLAAVAVISFFAITGVARADDKPAYGPPAKWVKVAETPTSPGGDLGPAIQPMLDDSQSLMTPDGLTAYSRRIARIVKPEGLSAGSRSITWDPTRDKVTLHSLTIIRDGQRIDLLKGGEDVLVLRREKELEKAMLDGRMTATIQIKDLRVGDMVDWAYSLERHDPILGPRVSDFERMSWSGAIPRHRVRVLWPNGVSVKWKTTAGFPTPKIGKSDGFNELLVDGTGVTAPKPPAGAPIRFQRVGEFQATTYRDWADVAAPMAPLYEQAAILAADSPLRAEIAAIAAASADPKVRAFKALQLVEDKTRYLFLGMGDGGYKPAPADETWARRFGDCKGKTVLLLALLNGLGIEAEAVLVNATGGGDGMDERVPSASQFNHVLVRARIDGKSYWLDGTRTGDRGGLDAQRPPPFLWGLPVRASGAVLEPIVQSALDQPDLEGVMRFDLSGGLDKPAPASMTMTLRGDNARVMARAIETLTRQELERGFKQSFSTSNSWLNIDNINWNVASDGTVVLSLYGTSDMEWRMNDDVGLREWRVPVTNNKAFQFPRREPGPNSDAPYAAAFPKYTAGRVEVTLPPKAEGFTFKGPSFEGRIANEEVRRSAEIRGGMVVFTEIDRSVGRELPLDQAEAANKARRQLADQLLIIRAPKGS